MSTAVIGAESRITMSNAPNLAGPPFDFKEFRKRFDSAYNEWFACNAISADLRSIIESQEISAEQFEILTKNRQFQKYIALIDGKIRFDELPGPPHGSIIYQLTRSIGRQLDGPNAVEALEGASDDGEYFHLNH
jgi:hypothetical protein